MAHDPIGDLHERLLSDDDLREEFRQSPHEVLERHGVELTDEQSQRLHEADLPSQSPEELRSKLEDEGLRAVF
jgi:hypothetical protein